MNFFIANAWADTATSTATTTGAAGGISQFLILIPLIIVFYFFLIRPQAKRAKEHRTLLANLAKGDEVITSGGILGKISKLTDDYIVLSIAENLEIKIQKNAIAQVLPKGTLNSI